LKKLQNNFLVSDHEIDHTAPHPTTKTIALKRTEVKWGSKCTHRAKNTLQKCNLRGSTKCALLVAEEVQETQTHPEKRQTNKQTKPAEKVTKVSDFVKPF
jgi:ribosomal protein L14E/L6E/L27E